MSIDTLIQETRKLVDECRVHVEGSAFNADKAKSIIAQLRMSMTRFDVTTKDTGLQTKQSFLAREILELAVLLSVRTKDEKSFERYFSQLKPYYFDLQYAEKSDSQRVKLPESERKQPIIGLYLLYLLAEGRIGDFHTELELHHDHHDRYVRYSIDLERDIMEGRYNKVWSARQNPPRDSYTYFVDKLMGTIRNDVAACIEASYESLSTADAAKLLFFGQPTAEFHEFWKNRGWELDSMNFTFSKPSGKPELPSSSLINQSLSYAHEIERII